MGRALAATVTLGYPPAEAVDDLKEIRLLGAAGRRFGRVFHLAVDSPAEAVQALAALFPEFRAWVLQQHDRGVAWRVVSGGRCLEEADVDRQTGAPLIVFAPVLAGAGGKVGAVIGIIAGIFLLAASFGSFGPVFLGLSGAKLTTLGTLGAGLLLSGVAQLLTPTPKAPSTVAAAKSNDLESNLFSRNQGTGGQGECVPLLYGRRLVSSPRNINFNLRSLPSTRSIYPGGTAGLLGYVDRQVLT